MSKTITIIDCFIDSEIVERNLKSCLEKFKKDSHEIFLISNKPASKEIISLTDFYFYDQRNQLFSGEYSGISPIDFWFKTPGFTVHNIKKAYQKHGLSVMINLFNTLHFCRRLGYTHFQRIETDDLFGPLSMEKIKKIPAEVEESGKKGLFYFNYDNNPQDISFHYFYCEIDHFIKNVSDIRSEQDYQDFLLKTQNNLDFRIVENLVFENLEKNEGDLLIRRNGKVEMGLDFPDTTWNTVTSQSNIDPKYQGSISEIYQKFESGRKTGYLIYSMNYSDNPKSRRIVLNFQDGSSQTYNHHLQGKSSWSYNDIAEVPISLDVFEKGSLLYSKKIETVESYIEFN